MLPKTPKTPSHEGPCSHGECLQVMDKMIKNLSDLIKSTYEKQMEALQHEIFTLRKELDEEKKKRKKMEENATTMSNEIKSVNGGMSYLMEQLQDMEQEKRNCDIVFENLDELSEVRDVSQHVCQTVNDTLMGTIIEKNDIQKTRIIKNKYKKNKVTIIATLSSEVNKKAILSQKKCSDPKVFLSKKISPRSDIAYSKTPNLLRPKTIINTCGQETATFF